ncbi:Na+/H+ antiporter [Propioniciclava tarda]|uniref:Na+/H+ antiporter n=1 Tax=Propioniciclava tarda TaxID=433330 RepID=A0A4Q9KN17_PROTD|nr:Na+/H+ antiporter [Propioniciclava tarda]TBT95380.1 Na+/H+ antiporter [Propioniciclava tarda]SMO78915.1 monovalent cation:H+ antiporter, CPA1 family [Propioniciclava tarda]
MEAALFVVGIVAVVVAVSGVSGRLGTSAPLLLTLVGIVIGYLPGFPVIEIDREIVLLGLLPPLLYAAAIRTSLIDLRANLKSIAMLSVALVVVTAAAVGVLLWQLLGIPLPLALAFGGVVAPPDAVAATAVAKGIGLPRRIVTLLEGESLFNDATALVIVKLGLVGLGAAVTAGDVGVQFLWSAGGGIAIGLVAMWVIRRVRGMIQSSVSDVAVSFICPWIAYLPAEAVHASGVLAVVTAGVLLGHKAHSFQSARSRLAERINWTTIQFILENGVFLLIGLQAHGIVERVQDEGIGLAVVVGVGAALLATVIAVRLAFMYLTIPLWRGSFPWSEAARAATVTGWAGMRGVVTLAAALSIPEDAPARDLLVLLALVVVAGTLLLQGYSLPWVARRMDIRGEDPREEALQRATVIERAVAAGDHALDALEVAGVPTEVVGALRSVGERRRHAAWERLGTTADVESPTDAYRRLRMAMLEAERGKLLKIRDTGNVSSEVLDEALGDADLEESMLTTLHQRQIAARGVLRTPERNRGDCEHLRDADDGRSVVPLTPEGCAECLADGKTNWVALRICLDCGHVGCCDSSPDRHATGHYEQTGHPVMRSFEPGEEWRWCYVDALPG